MGFQSLRLFAAWPSWLLPEAHSSKCLRRAGRRCHVVLDVKDSHFEGFLMFIVSKTLKIFCCVFQMFFLQFAVFPGEKSAVIGFFQAKAAQDLGVQDALLVAFASLISVHWVKVTRTVRWLALLAIPYTVLYANEPWQKSGKGRMKFYE